MASDTRGLDIRVEQVHKDFSKGGRTLEVLRGIDLHLTPGERIAIIGESGSGKSTFLHVVGTLDHPTSGRIWFDGQDVFTRTGADLDGLRNRRIGFVFQFHHLLPDQDALHNVMMPALIGGESTERARQRANDLLASVGLRPRASHRPGELSGGEQQRVAIARALMQSPGLLLADEPTGNLDPRTAEGVFDLLMDLNERTGTTTVVATHSLALASRFSRVFELVDGVFHERSP